MSDVTANEGSRGEGRAEHTLEEARAMTRRAAEIAERAAERMPAGVVVLVGGGVLLAAGAFGLGEVVTAGIAGYAAYRLLLRRRAQKRVVVQT
jgi:hypothetical protein